MSLVAPVLVSSLRAIFTGPPMRDVSTGIAEGRLRVDETMAPAIASLIGSMWMVLEGHQTWREAGSSTTELLLRALGIDPDEARAISTAALPAI